MHGRGAKLFSNCRPFQASFTVSVDKNPQKKKWWREASQLDFKSSPPLMYDDDVVGIMTGSIEKMQQRQPGIQKQKNILIYLDNY